MNCQHCGEKIPIFRRLGNERFCSEEHRREYSERLSEQGLALLLDRPSPAKFSSPVAVVEPERPRRRSRAPKQPHVNGSVPPPSAFIYDRPDGWENGCGRARGADTALFPEYRVYPNGLAALRGGARPARVMPLALAARTMPGAPVPAGPASLVRPLLPPPAAGTAFRGFRRGQALRLRGRTVPEFGWAAPMSLLEPRRLAGDLILDLPGCRGTAWDGDWIWAAGRISEPAAAMRVGCAALEPTVAHRTERSRSPLTLPGIATRYTVLRRPPCEPRLWPVLAAVLPPLSGPRPGVAGPSAVPSAAGWRWTKCLPAPVLPVERLRGVAGYLSPAAWFLLEGGPTAIFAWPMAWRQDAAVRLSFPIPALRTPSAATALLPAGPAAAAAWPAPASAPERALRNPLRIPERQFLTTECALPAAALAAPGRALPAMPGTRAVAPPAPPHLEAFVALPANRVDLRVRAARTAPPKAVAVPSLSSAAVPAQDSVAPRSVRARMLPLASAPGLPSFRPAAASVPEGWDAPAETCAAGPLPASSKASPARTHPLLPVLRPAPLRDLAPGPAVALPAPSEPVYQFQLLPEVSESMNRVKPRRAPASAWRSRLLARLGGAANPVARALDLASRLWSLPPALARGLALALPLMMVPTLFYMTGGTKVSAGSAWQNLQESIRQRATIELEDDFRSGLDGWSGDAGWEQSWSFDQAGFVLPARLALFARSLPLDNYRMEFVGQIERRGMSFAVRARDTANYHAVKFVIVAPGPLPRVNIVRYTVYRGAEGPRTELPMPLTLRNDTLYRVVVTAQGDRFTTSVNGQMVDQWSDDRLMTGGVGFFADRDSAFRLRSVRVVDKDDFLGWLCSQISPRTADSKATTGEKKQ